MAAKIDPMQGRSASARNDPTLPPTWEELTDDEKRAMIQNTIRLAQPLTAPMIAFLERDKIVK